MLYHYLSINVFVLIITWAILSMQCPFIHPYAYSVLILLFTVITTAVIIVLLSLFRCYYYYKTIATDNLCRARLFTGAAELTTPLLRLSSILWLPLCRINKFGSYSPRRLLRSPILVGHQQGAGLWEGMLGGCKCVSDGYELVNPKRKIMI